MRNATSLLRIEGALSARTVSPARRALPLEGRSDESLGKTLALPEGDHSPDNIVREPSLHSSEGAWWDGRGPRILQKESSNEGGMRALTAYRRRMAARTVGGMGGSGSIKASVVPARKAGASSWGRAAGCAMVAFGLWTTAPEARASDPFTGVFVDPKGGAEIVLRREGAGYAGRLRAGGRSARLEATRGAEGIGGFIHGPGEPLPWSARVVSGGLWVQTPLGRALYVRKGAAVRPSPKPSPKPARPSRSLPDASGGAAAARISGSRLYVMTRSSMLSRQRTGAYSEIDLCPGGVFFDRSEASVQVGGQYDGRRGSNRDWAGGASVQGGSGRWTVARGPGGAVLRLQWRSGQTASHPLSDVSSGSWRRGRTRFAMDWKKGRCP